jgi:thioesterase domain-containing protein/acyl carrier protein
MISQFLAELRAAGIEVRLKGDRLVCNAPKGAFTPELKTQLSDRKAEIIAFLSAALPDRAPDLTAIARDKDLPLSFAQERIWLLAQVEPDVPTYNIPMALRLTGPLNVAVLERCCTELIRRHEVLRTAFFSVISRQSSVISQDQEDSEQSSGVNNQQPTVAILPPPQSYTLPVIDLRAVDPDQRETEARLWMDKEAKRPLSLENPPLWRILLIQLSDNEWILVQVVHHIIADGWSLRLILDELAQLYTAFVEDRLSPLPENTIQYVDFAAWQKQYLSGDVKERQLNYWKQQFAGEVAAVQLPVDLPQPRIPSNAGTDYTRALDATLTQNLRTFAQQQGVSLLIVLLAAFNILLNRYSGQEDLTICMPVVGRGRTELDRLVGYFNNILPLRNDLSGDPSLRELLQRLRGNLGSAFEYQDIPFHEIASLPSLSHTPLSLVLLDLQEASDSYLEIPGIAARSLPLNSGTADFDLSLFIQDAKTHLAITASYKTDRFSEGAIAQLLDNFQIVLAHLVQDPLQPISTFPQFELPVVEKSETPESLYVAPTDDLERQLVELWQECLGIERIGIRDNFFNLGGRSLIALQLSDRMQKVLAKKIPLATLFQAPTIEQLAKVLRSPNGTNPLADGEHSAWKALAPVQPNGHKRPLFLCQGVGIYSPLIPYLDRDRPIYGLVALTPEGNAAPYESVEGLAAEYIAEMRQLQPEGPYLLGGLSYGGIIAYEMAQQLVASGQKVDILALFDTILPTAYQPLSRSQRLKVHVKRFFNNPAYLLEKGQEVGQGLWQKAQRLYGKFALKMGLPIPHSIGYFAIQEVNDSNAAYYEPKPYPGTVTLFKASDPVDLETAYVDPLNGWGPLAKGGVELVDIVGTHLGILEEPQVATLATKLNKFMEATEVISHQ